jgi:hypothetical protein
MAIAVRALPNAITRWFIRLHGGQVVMLWLIWGVIFWALRWPAMAEPGPNSDIWVWIFFVFSFAGATLLAALTWAWFEARRTL